MYFPKSVHTFLNHPQNALSNLREGEQLPLKKKTCIEMISVIIPAKNTEDTIGNCLRAVLSQRYVNTDYEVIVVDDGSTDRTAEIAKSMRARVIQQENAGPAAARNAGAEAAYGEILAFTDADCVPSPEWLHYLTMPFRDPQVIGTKGTYRTKLDFVHLGPFKVSNIRLQTGV